MQDLPVRHQVGAQLAHLLIALVFRLGQRTLHDGDQLARQRGVNLPERLRDLLQDLVERRRERITFERLFPGQQLVDDDADREDVGPLIRTLAADLLGRHVVERAHQHVRVGELRGHEPRETEVEDLDGAALGDEDVRRLHVAVHDAAAVGVLEPFADIDREIQLPRQAHLLGAPQPPLQILPVQVLHREVGLPLVLAEIVDGDDVLVRQLTGGARLPKEALAHFRVRLDGAGNDLDGDDALDERIEGAVDDTHAALPKLLLELIAANRLHGWRVLA